MRRKRVERAGRRVRMAIRLTKDKYAKRISSYSTRCLCPRQSHDSRCFAAADRPGGYVPRPTACAARGERVTLAPKEWPLKWSRLSRCRSEEHTSELQS